MQLPQEFTERMQCILGTEYAAFEQSYQETRSYGLRVNTKKISAEKFEQIAPFHLTPIPWIPGGYYYLEEDAPARHPFYYAGLYYLQEPSATAPASIRPVEPGERVLDLWRGSGRESYGAGGEAERRRDFGRPMTSVHPGAVRCSKISKCSVFPIRLSRMQFRPGWQSSSQNFLTRSWWMRPVPEKECSGRMRIQFAPGIRRNRRNVQKYSGRLFCVRRIC